MKLSQFTYFFIISVYKERQEQVSNQFNELQHINQQLKSDIEHVEATVFRETQHGDQWVILLRRFMQQAQCMDCHCGNGQSFKHEDCTETMVNFW